MSLEQYLTVYGSWLAPVVALVIMGQALRQLQGTLILGLILVTVAPSPISLWFACVYALLMKVAGFLRIGE